MVITGHSIAVELVYLGLDFVVLSCYDYSSGFGGSAFQRGDEHDLCRGAPRSAAAAVRPAPTERLTELLPYRISVKVLTL